MKICIKIPMLRISMNGKHQAWIACKIMHEKSNQWTHRLDKRILQICSSLLCVYKSTLRDWKMKYYKHWHLDHCIQLGIFHLCVFLSLPFHVHCLHLLKFGYWTNYLLEWTNILRWSPTPSHQTVKNKYNKKNNSAYDSRLWGPKGRGCWTK